MNPVKPATFICELCGWPCDDTTCCEAHERYVCQECFDQYEHPKNAGVVFSDGHIIPCGITWEPPSHDEMVYGLQLMERDLR